MQACEINNKYTKQKITTDNGEGKRRKMYKKKERKPKKRQMDLSGKYDLVMMEKIIFYFYFKVA